MDLHSHLDLYPDALRILPEVSRRNVFTLVVTTSPRAWLATSKVFSGYENIKVSLGLHPEIVERKATEKALLLSSIPHARFIGEIGLDGSPRFRSSFSLQEEIFVDTIAECERQGGRIMSIHSRAAAPRVLDILEKYPSAGIPILHWFSGTVRELSLAVELGCWFSVGPAMLAGQTGRTLTQKIPRERLLPETDGPFATSKGAPLMPWQAMEVVPILAQLWQMTEGEVFTQLSSNLGELFAIEAMRGYRVNE